MAKFKCPHCGHLQNRDGVCEGCDISKVLPIEKTPKFIKGVRYKCDNCNRQFRSYNGICPICGKGKLMPKYRNHKRFKKSSRFLRFIITVLVIAMLIFGAAFLIPRFFPNVAEKVSDTVFNSLVELKNRFYALHSNVLSDYLKDDDKTASSNGNNMTPQNHPTTKPQPSAKSQPITKNSQLLSFGDMATVGNLEFTVKKMVFSDYSGDLQGYGSKDSDYKYCVLYLDVYNPTNENIIIREDLFSGISAMSDFGVNLLFDGEVNYSHTFGNYTEFLFGNTDILPRATLTDKVISFKVPVSITTSDEPLVFSMSYKGKVKASWELR